jgi:hypothetical protein
MWKVVVLYFPLIGKWLVWKVGARRTIEVGENPWVGCDGKFRLQRHFVVVLREGGFF